jgi:hypothetical protein
MGETYYRLHAAGRDATGPLEFHADNAYSALWGTEFVPGDASHAVCSDCAGTGDDSVTGGEGNGCAGCRGDGCVDLPRGYSCCATAQELLDYMAEHGTPADHDDVVVFTGHQVDTGFDGELLVVPEHVVRWRTWPEFVAEETTS